MGDRNGGEPDTVLMYCLSVFIDLLLAKIYLMKKILTPLFVLLFFSAKNLKAQNPLTETSFSHFYFVIDSVAYHTLKTDVFCKHSLFYSSEGSSKMDQGTWSGNYVQGEFDYWEVFSPKSLDNAVTGGIGLGHMLHRPYEVHKLQQQWQSLTKDSIGKYGFTNSNGKDTIIVELMNYRDSMLNGGMACFFVMYYHPAILYRTGFTKEHIRDTGIDQKTLYKKWYAKKGYDRLYKKTEKLYLILTPQEYERHQIALQAMGYKKTGKGKFIKEIEIDIEIKENATNRLKKIEFSLYKPVEKSKIILSPDVYISLSGTNGTLVMK